MNRIIITTESGSDISANEAAAYGIEVVPMHISLGDQEYDDGAFPADDVCTYYDTHGELPKTSGCSPADFEGFFDRVHAKYPDRHIFHLAYSGVTTVSYASALNAAEGRDYITILDTRHVSGGLKAVVLKAREFLLADPDITPERMKEMIEPYFDRTRMCFIPSDLKYLHAGGRCSNFAFIGATILQLHPLIEILGGRLLATRKYRGSMDKVCVKLLEEYAAENDLDHGKLFLVRSPGLPESVQSKVYDKAKELGFENIEWSDTGCVITVHGGPGAFGIVGYSVQE